MDTIEAPRIEKKETLKDVIQIISAINNEMNAELHMIADALMYGGHLANDDKTPNDQLSLMDSLRYERGKAEENLKLIMSIRECLW